MNEETQNELSSELSGDIENKYEHKNINYNKDIICSNDLTIIFSKDRKYISILQV